MSNLDDFVDRMQAEEVLAAFDILNNYINTLNDEVLTVHWLAYVKLHTDLLKISKKSS